MPVIISIEAVIIMSQSRNSEINLFALLMIIGTVINATNAKSPSKIRGGQLATGSEFGAVVSLSKPGIFVHYCGAAIIEPRHILTAAHCVQNISHDISVHAGMHHIKDTSNVVERLVTKIIIHPNYRPSTNFTTVQNDIAVLVLDNALPIGGRIQKLKLPIQKPEETYGYVFAGWGVTDPEPSDYQMELKTITMTLVYAERCNGYLFETICGTSEIGALCGGDSGSPLMKDGYIYGIASMSQCLFGKPANFASVFHYHNWILATIRQN